MLDSANPTLSGRKSLPPERLPHAPRAGDLLTSLALPAIFRLHRGA